jgi:hypothetical protein
MASIPSAVQPGARPEAPPGVVLCATRFTRTKCRRANRAAVPEAQGGINVNYTFNFSPGNLNISLSDIWKDETYHASSTVRTTSPRPITKSMLA